MSETRLPQGYRPVLGLYDTQKAIGLIKQIFEVKLCAALHLKRVTAPLFVDPAMGLNDDLSGVERPVSFEVPATGGTAQVVHSLAKWKRLALHQYGFRPGNGLVTDMNAIRRDEELDNLHSIYVDQWDWEKVITSAQRTEAFLHGVVQNIVYAISATLDELKWQFPDLSTTLRREVTFVTSQQLEARWPALSPKQRENVLAREAGSVFSGGIGAPALSQHAAGGRTAPHHRRRHRSKPPVHAAALQDPCGRGAGKPVGRGHPPGLRSRRGAAAVKNAVFARLWAELFCQNALCPL